VINALDETLKALLRRGLPTAWGQQVQISFATPDDQFPPQSLSSGLPAIDLFLYDVRENLDLRTNEVYVERRANGTAVQTRAPVRVDFSYLITAWPSTSVPDPAEDEHHLLGEVMRVLLRYRTIPQEILQGELASQHLPLPVSSLQPGRLQSLGEFWQALGGKPKAALNYLVTLAVEVAEPITVPLVTDNIIKMRMETERTGE
jgi:Pvc16 N-terminal domain